MGKNGGNVLAQLRGILKMQLSLFPVKKDLEEYPEVTDFGYLGVKWRGENIPLSDSIYEDDYTVIFGFTCAECGGSGVNQDPVMHSDNCKRKGGQ